MPLVHGAHAIEADEPPDGHATSEPSARGAFAWLQSEETTAMDVVPQSDRADELVLKQRPVLGQKYPLQLSKLVQRTQLLSPDVGQFVVEPLLLLVVGLPAGQSLG